MNSQGIARPGAGVAPDWRRGLARLVATLAGLAIVGLCAWGLIVWSVDRHLILAGMLLLLGGYLTLLGLMIAVDWIRRGFRGG
jgi:hypothetical protein